MVSPEDANKVLLDTDFPRYQVALTNWEDMEYIPIKELHQSYRIQVLSCVCCICVNQNFLCALAYLSGWVLVYIHAVRGVFASRNVFN